MTVERTGAKNLAQERNGLAEHRTELAEERTEQAEDRTHLAELRTERAGSRTALALERTISAWVRTGITAEITGLGLAKLLGRLGMPLLTLSSGVLFILVAMGAYAFALATWRHSHDEIARNHGSRLATHWLIQAMLLLLLLTAILAFILLFIPFPNGALG